MAKISISNVLEARKRVRLLTVLASLVLILVLFEGLILHNPKSSKAAYVESGNNVIMNGDFLIDQNGKVFSNDIGESLSNVGDLTNKVVTIQSGTTTFVGGQVTLDALHVNNGAIVTQTGPTKTDGTVLLTESGQFGMTVSGWIKIPDGVPANSNIQLVFDDNARGFFSDDPVHNSQVLTYRQGGNRGDATAKVTGGNWYFYSVNIINLRREIDLSFYIPGTADPNPPTGCGGPRESPCPLIEHPLSFNNFYGEKGLNSSIGKAHTSIYQETDVTGTNVQNGSDIDILDGSTNGFSETTEPVIYNTFKKYFNPKNLISPPDWTQDFVTVGVDTGYYSGNSFPGITLSDLPVSPWQTVAGPQRGVNLKITNDLIVDTGAKFDVSARGYSGGINANSRRNGSGPGGGKESNSDNGGGGGGHGGRGGQGLDAGIDANDGDFGNGGVPYDSFFNPVDNGSGGASAQNNYCFGGSGGGAVLIDAKNIVVENGANILADGGIAFNPSGSSSSIKCGGGAGGTINLKARDQVSIPMTNNSLSVVGGQGGFGDDEPGGDGSGGRVSIVANLFSVASADNLNSANDPLGEIFVNISPPRVINPSVDINTRQVVTYAQRGTAYVSSGGVSNNIRKVLIPISRTNLTPANDFNPYALQTGDRIQVNITVSNLTIDNEATITDDVLTTSKTSLSAKICKPVPGSYNIDPDETETTSTSIVWKITPTTVNPVPTISYYCDVQDNG